MWLPRRTQIVLLSLVAASSAAVAWVGLNARGGNEPAVAASDVPAQKEKRVVSDTERARYVVRGRIWRAPSTPISRASFANRNVDVETCRFKVSTLGGTTPKFDCVLATGEEVRIKYGSGPEIPAETAATRLLSALGFGADRITLVRTLRCHGCPDEPFSTMRTVELTRAEPLFKHVVDYNDIEEFSWVALERKFGGWPIETEKLEGWSMFELDTVDSAHGGAPRAHVDALRLIAVLLAHWDNKSENQRLVCLDSRWPEDSQCRMPFLLLQDVGATFGPVKMDLEAWQAAAIWEDRNQCIVSMREMPFEGATFGRATITERGRSFVGELLSQLSDDQLRELFTESLFAEKRGLFGAVRSVDDWTATFQAKVRAITDGPPCPQPS